MKKIFVLVLGGILILGTPFLGSAQQAQDEWLVGKWQGVLQDLGDSSFEAGRILRVTAAPQGGGVQGFWYISGREQYPAKITIEGPTIGVVTAAKSVVELRRKGQNQLEGSLTTSAGKSFPIALKKILGPRSDAELRPLIQNSGMIAHPKFEVPEDFTFRDVKTGRKVSLQRDLKDQVVLINVWATWCLPCVREMPSLEGLHRSLRDRDLVVLGVNYEAVSMQRSYLDLYKVTFPCLVGPVNDLSFRLRNWWPQTYLIDRQGRLVASKGGPQDWAMPDVQQLITAMLGDE